MELNQSQVISGNIYYSKELGYWRVKFSAGQNLTVDTELVRFAPGYPQNDLSIPDELYLTLKTLLSDIVRAMDIFGRQVSLFKEFEPICK